MNRRNKFEMFNFYIVPQVRAEVVSVLKERDLKQKEIAEMLHVTEACISQVIKKKRGRTNKYDVLTDKDKQVIRAKLEIHETNEDNLFDIIWGVSMQIMYRDYYGQR